MAASLPRTVSYSELRPSTSNLAAPSIKIQVIRPLLWYNNGVKTKWKIGVFCSVWVAFFAFGVYLRTMMPWDEIANLHGLDYTAHGIFFSDYRRIFMPGFRHPFLAFITAPLPLFGGRLLELGLWPYWCSGI